MSKVHIGKKIQEVLKKKGMKATDFAKKISLTRNGAYKVFEKETIDTGQLSTISKVLDYDFFMYYGNNAQSIAKDTTTKPEYGYATKSELADVVSSINMLAKEIEKLRSDLPVKSKATKKTALKKKTK